MRGGIPDEHAWRRIFFSAVRDLIEGVVSHGLTL
jgi:hypothetical protein